MLRNMRSFSTSRRAHDLATCQLLGNFGSTPTTFTTRNGTPGVSYLFAVNYPTVSSGGEQQQQQQATSWFNVVSFDERNIERLTREDLKGAKALVNGALRVKRNKDEETGVFSDAVTITQKSLHIIERSKKQQALQASGEARQAAAGEEEDAEAEAYSV